MVQPLHWSRGDNAGDLPNDLPGGLRGQITSIVNRVDAEDVMIDAIDPGTDDVFWVVTVRFDTDRLTDREQDDVLELTKSVSNRKQIEVIENEEDDENVFRFEYHPRNPP